MARTVRAAIMCDSIGAPHRISPFEDLKRSPVLSEGHGRIKPCRAKKDCFPPPKFSPA